MCQLCNWSREIRRPHACLPPCKDASIIYLLRIEHKTDGDGPYEVIPQDAAAYDMPAPAQDYLERVTDRFGETHNSHPGQDYHIWGRPIATTSIFAVDGRSFAFWSWRHLFQYFADTAYTLHRQGFVINLYKMNPQKADVAVMAAQAAFNKNYAELITSYSLDDIGSLYQEEG